MNTQFSLMGNVTKIGEKWTIGGNDPGEILKRFGEGSAVRCLIGEVPDNPPEIDINEDVKSIDPDSTREGGEEAELEESA